MGKFSRQILVQMLKISQRLHHKFVLGYKGHWRLHHYSGILSGTGW